MVDIAIAVKHHGCDVLFPRFLRHQCAHLFGGLNGVCVFKFSLQLFGTGRYPENRCAVRIINQLCVDMLQASVNGQPRPRGSPKNLLPDSFFASQMIADFNFS
jgi:hypothetical protein